ncbi:hypothetical protein ScPMuIL_009254 [Solemya velum]
MVYITKSLRLYAILMFTLFYNVDCETLSSGDILHRINELHNKIGAMQIKKTTNFYPPLSWAKMKGVYESDVKEYFRGNPEMYFMREKFKIFDNNMFATAWVTTVLLETNKFARGPKPSEQQIKMSLEAISEHSNKNYNFSNSIMTFWRQKFNASTGVWVCAPENLLEFFKMTYDLPWPVIEELLRALGLDKVEEVIKKLLSTRNGYLAAFQVPADFDDTFVNIGIGSLLRGMRNEFPESNSFWTQTNDNLTFIFSEMKRVAYRPLSSEESVNTIDPRTYFYIRKFLQNAVSDKKDLALITTWVQNLDDVRKYAGKGNDIPGNINNVDVTVAANVIFGITNGILTGLLDATLLDDADLQQLYLNTSTLISYEIMTNLSNRQDLALTYYPAELEFYWFVSRTFTQLERRSRTGVAFPHPALKTVWLLFGEALLGHAYQVIVDKAIPDGNDKVYFDNFIGNGDRSWTNKPVMRGEDRIFTTSMAANALITMWTVFDDSIQTLRWHESTPRSVKDTMGRAVNWLYDNVLSGAYKPWNAMFSGSYRGFTTIEIWYPRNRFEFTNGTKVTNTSQFPTSKTIQGVQGVPPESWYEAELQKKHYGFYTPQVFHGYNADEPLGLVFPFWSSEPYTYASTLLALSSYLNNVRQILHKPPTSHMNRTWKMVYITKSLRLFAILVFTLFYNVDCETLSSGDILHRINELHNKIGAMQIKKTTSFYPPLSWAKMKGVYESDVKQYFRGNPEMHFMREKFKIFDNNMFATAWVTTALLETNKFARGPKPSEQQIKMSLEAISKHSNKNYNFSNSIMTFWRQKFNASTGVWVCAPENLLEFFKMTYDLPWPVIEELLRALGLDTVIKKLLSTRNGYLAVFQVPADFDDTFVNVGIGSLLRGMRNEFPESNSFWTQQNNNLTFIFSEMKRVAYRPLSSAENVNTIDPRTYFYIRKFLQNAVSDKKDLALITTWVQNLDDVRKYAGKGNDIPGNINNVDVTVAANVIFGITNGILTGLFDATLLDDADIQQLYLNTSTLISYEIMTNLSNRPDLALAYYPAEFEFYWFVSRTFTQLERRSRTGVAFPHPAMKTVWLLFGEALIGYAYQVIVDKAIPDGNDKVYFDNFIGNGDRSWTNKPVMRGEDRIFTTSMAVNALITMWTVFDDSIQTLEWHESTPLSVKDTVRKALNWLYDNVLSGAHKPWNAMFSGSYRGFTTKRRWYPRNRFEFTNGTKVSNTSQFPTSKTIQGVQGVPPESWYEAELQKKHYGFYTPQVFHGYNADEPLELVFPFWSSEPTKKTLLKTIRANVESTAYQDLSSLQY